MPQSIVIDILNQKAFKLLKDLEDLDLIRLKEGPAPQTDSALPDWASEFKGKMARQPLEEVERQLDELRKEWD